MLWQVHLAGCGDSRIILRYCVRGYMRPLSWTNMSSGTTTSHRSLSQTSFVLRCGLAGVPCGDGQHLSPCWDTSHCLLAPPGQPAHQGASQCPEAPGLTGLVDDERISGLQLPDGVGHMVTAGPARERQVDVPEGQSPADLRRLRFGRAVMLRRFPEQDGSCVPPVT